MYIENICRERESDGDINEAEAKGGMGPEEHYRWQLMKYDFVWKREEKERPFSFQAFRFDLEMPVYYSHEPSK